MLKFLKKIEQTSYYLIFLYCELCAPPNDKIVSGFKIDFLCLKGENILKNLEKTRIRLEELTLMSSNLGNHHLIFQSFLLNKGLKSSQKRLLMKILDVLIFKKSLLNEKIRFKTENQIYKLENLKFFELPCFEKIHKKPLHIPNINYFYCKSFLSRVYWRFNFSTKNNENILIISMYAPLLKIMNYSIIRDRNLQVIFHLILIY